MGYNRTLDLLAMSLAFTQANKPVQAAAYMHDAATDPSAQAAVEAIFAANKKKKPAKKKAKASTAREIFAEAEGEEDEGEDTVEALVAALADLDDPKPAVSAKVRAARRALAEAEAEAEEEEEEKEEAETAESEDEVFKLSSSRRAKADTVDNPDLEVGEDLREEVPATRSKASFARALRNLAARSK